MIPKKEGQKMPCNARYLTGEELAKMCNKGDIETVFALRVICDCLASELMNYRSKENCSALSDYFEFMCSEASRTVNDKK